ncbi:MAG: hypothetical protein ACWGQW_01420 [bacterium]
MTADEATPESTCVVMAREGVRGVWFSLAEAEAIRRMRLELPELRLQVQRLEQLTAVQGERVTLYRESMRLRAEALTTAQQQLEQALEREARLRDRLGAWYRSPALWFAVGSLVTTVAYVAIVFGVN